MKENTGFPFSHYAPAGGCVCWYCGKSGERFARYDVTRKGGTIYDRVVAEVCPACEPKARNGERGNG